MQPYGLMRYKKLLALAVGEAKYRRVATQRLDLHPKSGLGSPLTRKGKFNLPESICCEA